MAAASTAPMWSESEEKLPKNWNRLEVPKAQFFRIDFFFYFSSAGCVLEKMHRSPKVGFDLNPFVPNPWGCFSNLNGTQEQFIYESRCIGYFDEVSA